MESFEQLNYNGLLMLHLSRISAITTGSFIDSVDKSSSQKFIDPKSVGETSLDWGATFLLCLVPDEFQDEVFKNDRKVYLGIENNVVKDFSRIKAVVNLLNRKGLLLGNKNFGQTGLRDQFFNEVRKD